MMKKIGSYLINILLAAFSLAVGLLLAEALLPFLKIPTIEEAVYQARRPVVQGRYGRFHPTLQYTLEKNLKNKRLFYPDRLDYHVDTNQQGFRGDEWDPSPERKNILLLGDSFGFGWGVEWNRTAGELIEKRLQRIDQAFQVVNLSMPGWDLDRIIGCFETYKDTFNPLGVVYLFCPNDTLCRIDEIGPGRYDLTYRPEPDAEKRFQEMILRQQPEYWSWNRFYRSSYCKAYHARIIRPLFSKRIYQSLRVDPVPRGYDFPPPIPPPEISALNKKEARFLNYCLNRISINRGSNPLYLLDTSDKSILVKADRADNRRWILRQFSRKTPQTYHMDFETHIRKTKGSRQYFFEYDDHWTAEGHAAAAEQILYQMARTLPELKSITHKEP